MQDRDLYARIPGIREPGRVGSVGLKLSEGEVHVRLARHEVSRGHARSAVNSVSCTIITGSGAGGILDSWRYRTILHPEPARTKMSATWGAQREVAMGRAFQPFHRDI